MRRGLAHYLRQPDDGARTIRKWTGREATVIDDPYENEEWLPQCQGNEVLWLGHSANIESLFASWASSPNCESCSRCARTTSTPSALEWSPETERRSLARAAVVLVTGNNPGASANRIVKALRAGRFVVTPGGAPAWDEFKPYIWMGDVREGIEWAFNNREEACAKIKAGQAFVRERNSPGAIARMWMDVFDSILPQDTSGKRDGSALT